MEAGDLILADRGFTIEENFAIRGVKLTVPPFTKGKSQLSKREVEKGKQISRVRIHVKRAIGVLKNRYTFLKSPLPVRFVMSKDKSGIDTIDKIVTVCCITNKLG